MKVSVIGGANFDISAGLSNNFIANDSNPGHITLGHGGVARNIAHNLVLMGCQVQFISLFGGDIFGGLIYDQCKRYGIDMSLSEHISDERTGLYLCINNHAGEMIAAVADTDIIRHITPAFLEKRTGVLNQSDAIIADTNLPEDTIQYLLENSTAPVFIDAVSTTKAHKVVNALKNSKLHHLHTLKLNIKEALAVTNTSNHIDAAQQLMDLGVEHLYITLGGEGVYCLSRMVSDEFSSITTEKCDTEGVLFPALPGEIVNTTGAGDAFLAGVVFAFLKNIPFPQTAQYGLMAARATLMSEKAVNPDIANILL